MLTFVLGIAVGLLAGWWIWGRAAAHDHHDHGAHTHDGQAHGATASDATTDDENLTPTPLIDSGDAIAPTGVPHIVDNRIDVPIDNEPITAEGRAAADAASEPTKADDMPPPPRPAPSAKPSASPKPAAKSKAAASAKPVKTGAASRSDTSSSTGRATPLGSAARPVVPETAAVRAREIGIAPPETGTRSDDLTQIKGIGGKLEEMLQRLGVYTFAQMANWSDEEVDRVDENLTAFKGRIRRDDWRAQARDLRG